jgi:hypothetical protein
MICQLHLQVIELPKELTSTVFSWGIVLLEILVVGETNHFV